MSVLNRPKFALQETKEEVLLKPFLTSPPVENSIISWTPQMNFEHHISPPAILCSRAGPAGHLHLCQKVFLHAFQQPPVCPLSAVLSFQQTSGKLESPARPRASGHEESDSSSHWQNTLYTFSSCLGGLPPGCVPCFHDFYPSSYP